MDETMNLGIVTPQLSHYGGSEIYLLECLKRWQKELKITVYTPSFKKKLFEEFGIRRNVKIVRLPSSQRGNNQYKLLQESIVLPRIWEQKLLHHHLYFLYLFPTQMIRRRPSVWFAAEPMRMLYDLRHRNYFTDEEIGVHFYPMLNYDKIKVSDLNIILQLIEKLDSPLMCDRLATNSCTTGQYLENVYGRKPDRIVYPGINVRKGTTPTPNSEKILFVGRLWKHKRVDLIIKALSFLSRGELIIVGEGPEKPFLKKLSDDLELRARVRFAGDVTKGQLQRLYSECTCCVYTPIREPFGMVPLEAAAAGRPVVATIGGGYSEILNESCALFVPASAEKIAEAIQTLFDNPALARKMGEEGKKTVAHYTWDRTADTLLKLFYDTVRNDNEKKSGHRTQLGAHYYPWYRAGKKPQHWNENQEFAAVTDFPVSGPYSSNSVSLIRRHLQMAADSGIDFFVVNCQVTFEGFNPTELSATRKLFRVVEKEGYPIYLSILLALDTEDPNIIKSSIRTVREEFFSLPVYHRIRNHPILWYFMNDPFLGYFFYHHRELVSLNRNCYPIATGGLPYNKFLPRLLRDFFSGWCLYSPLEAGSEEKRKSAWKGSYMDFSEDGGRILIFTLCPGYDDSRLTHPQRKHNIYRVIPRNDLKTYEDMQKFALILNPSPDLLVITSFNEFHENTHIEPSEKFGDIYLKSTKIFKKKLTR
jgi:glycosyltransferase involved in cell wall biosynthesis